MELTEFKKHLRLNQTEAESRLWRILRGRRFGGLKFKRQEILGPYIVDFVCYQKFLIIEVDGGQHFFEENLPKDKARTKFLESRGFQVIRFSNLEVLKQTTAVADCIYLTLMKIKTWMEFYRFALSDFAGLSAVKICLSRGERRVISKGFYRKVGQRN